jgi:exosortase/archaeosortase family protein
MRFTKRAFRFRRFLTTNARRYITSGFYCLAGYFLFCILKYPGLTSDIAASALLPAIPYLLWLRLKECDEPCKLRFSFLAAAASLGCFTALALRHHTARHIWTMTDDKWLLLLGVCSGWFVRLPLQEGLRRVRKHWRATCVFLFCAVSPWTYFVLWYTRVFAFVSLTTTHITSWLLNNCGIAVENYHTRKIIIESAYFKIEMSPPCSGLEGVFMAIYMLSLLFLWDWDFFSKKRLSLIYALVISAMFLMNSIRIALFFTVGHWAYHPNAWEWIQRFRGAPLYLFHSYIGWILYLMTFWLLVHILYKTRSKPDSQSTP